MPYRLPVNSRRFHGDMRAVFGRQPFRQCHEILGRRLERADLSLSRAIHHMAHAGHHCILVNIKTGTMPMQNFHRFSLNAAGLEPPLSKSRTRAPGLSPARDTIWGAQGFRVRLTDGLARTKMTPTSEPAARRQLTQDSHPFHILRVGDFGGRLTRNNAARDGATTLNAFPAK